MSQKSALFLRGVSLTTAFLFGLTLLPLGMTAKADDEKKYNQYDSSPKLQYTTDWYGNSFSGATEHVQSWITNSCVAPDGTVLTTSNWDEGFDEVSAYKDGQQLGALEATHGSTDGTAVATNGVYLWATAGTDKLKSGTVDGMGSRNTVNLPTGTVASGLAANDTYLYVSDSARNQILVLDAETGAQQGSFPVQRPGRLALDSDGNLWVLQGADASGTYAVLEYQPDGTQVTANTITFAGTVKPTALAFNAKTGQLMVADDGIDQNVKLYATAHIQGTPTAVDGTFGTQYGIESGTPGVTAPLKFHDLVGVGADADGNLYVTFGGEFAGWAEVQAYSADGSHELWNVYSNQWLLSGAPDPTSDNSFYSTFGRFTKDYSQGAGQGWTYAAYTLNKFKYPDDPRLHTAVESPFIRIIDGQKFMFASEQGGNTLAIYRFDEQNDGETAIPCGYISSTGLFDAAEPDFDYFTVAGTKYEAENANSKWAGFGFWFDSNLSGGNALCDTGEDAWAEYDNVDFGTGTTSFTAHIASVNALGTMQIHLDSIDGPLLGTIDLQNTGGFQTYQDATGSIASTSGKHNIYIVFKQKATGNEYPAVGVAPDTGEFMWIDTNGDAKIEKDEIMTNPANVNARGVIQDAPTSWDWDITTNGDIWKGSEWNDIRKFTMKGINQYGVLEYGYDSGSLQTFSAPVLKSADGSDTDANGDPEAWTSIERTHYDPATDTMFISGYSADNGPNNVEFGKVGQVIVRYDDWSTLNRHQVWRVDLSQVAPYCTTDKSWDFAGKYMFLGYIFDGRITVYDTETGQLVGHMYGGPTVGGGANVGWLDIPYAISARQLADGSYVITEEEDLNNKQVVYEWSGDTTPDPAGDTGLPPFPADINLSKTSQAINVDAKFSESDWQSALNIPVATPTGGQDKNVVVFGALYDDAYLYLGATVKDSSLNKTSDQQWNNDAMEFYIDGNDDKLGRFDQYDQQLIFGWNFDQDELFTSSWSDAQRAQIKRAWYQTSDGYNIELAIPWSVIGITPQSGSKIGLDASNDQNSDGSVRAGSLVANGDGTEYNSNINYLNFVFAGAAPQPGSDATLSGLTVNGATVSGFDAATTAYNIELPAGTATVPAVAATPADPNAHAVVTDAASLPGDTTVTVKAADGIATETYTIHFTVKAPEAVTDDFDGPLASVWTWDTPLSGPTYSLSGGAFSLSVPDTSTYDSWNGIDNAPKLIRTDMGNGDWSIETGLNLSSYTAGDSFHSGLAVQLGTDDFLFWGAHQGTGLWLERSGEPQIFSVSYPSPQVYLKVAKAGATYTFYYKANAVDDWTTACTYADSDPSVVRSVGLFTKTWESTAVTTDFGYFSLTSGEASQPSSDATLSGLTVNGAPVSGFDAATTDYSVVLPAGTTTIPTVAATPNDTGAHAVVTQAAALPGTATVIVTAADGTATKTYTIHFTVETPQASFDATLSGLTVNGAAVSGFDAATTDYSVVLPAGTTTIPTVAATPNDTGAHAVVTQAAALPGTATVVVTAADGTATKTYTIRFTVAASSGGGTTTPIDVTVTGTTTGSGASAATTATIPADRTDPAAVANVTVDLGNVTVTAPASILNAAFGGNLASSLRLSQAASPELTQSLAIAAATAAGTNALTVLDINLTRITADGTSTALHQLGGNAGVTIHLTAAELASVTDTAHAHLYYYDPANGTLTDMHAAFDLAAGTATFSTDHFSTYVLAVDKPAATAPIGVSYSAHVQKLGWLASVLDGALGGTTGRSLRAEAVKLSLTGTLPEGAKLTYQAHVQKLGWLPAVSNGAVAGTTGKALRLEALRVTLSGLPGYAVQYRAHVQGRGWLAWQTAANGTDLAKSAVAGTTGQALRLEAIEVRIVKVS